MERHQFDRIVSLVAIYTLCADSARRNEGMKRSNAGGFVSMPMEAELREAGVNLEGILDEVFIDPEVCK